MGNPGDQVSAVRIEMPVWWCYGLGGGEADFNVYAVEWTPKDVRFYLNGKLQHTWTQEIARVKLPQNILFTIWPSNVASWAGALSISSVPSSAQIDWIKVYDWKG